MKSFGRFSVIGVGGLLLLMLLAGLVVWLLEVERETLQQWNLVQAWLLYRLLFFVGVIASWPWICRALVRSRLGQRGYQQDLEILMRQRWKVALCFVLLEGVIIQQLGL